MKGFLKIIHILKGQLLASFCEVRVWIGYAIGIMVALKGAYVFRQYAGERVFQMFEPYIMNFQTVGNVTLMLLGFVIVISDAPFINQRSALTLYRTSRGQWFWAMTLYITVHSVMYFVISVAASAIFNIGQAYAANLWSRPMDNLARFQSTEALVKWNLASPGELLVTEYSPYRALFFTLLLIWLYSLILAELLFLLNARFNKAAGTIAAAAVHAIGYILMFDGITFIGKNLSLYYHGLFSNHVSGSISIVTSVCCLLLVLCILLFTGPALLSRADFSVLAGEKSG